MLRLVYRSTASHAFTQPELLHLLNSSRRRNQMANITGVLLYHKGHFFQVLEGPDDVVRSVYTRICNDPRHRFVQILFEESAAERLFDSWSMGFVPVESLPNSEQQSFTDLLLNSAQANAILPQPSMIRLLLKTFRTAPAQ